jgi:hypothetical protein
MLSASRIEKKDPMHLLQGARGLAAAVLRQDDRHRGTSRNRTDKQGDEDAPLVDRHHAQAKWSVTNQGAGRRDEFHSRAQAGLPATARVPDACRGAQLGSNSVGWRAASFGSLQRIILLSIGKQRFRVAALSSLHQN